MHSWIRRVISLVIALLLIFGLVPPVFADADEQAAFSQSANGSYVTITVTGAYLIDHGAPEIRAIKPAVGEGKTALEAWTVGNISADLSLTVSVKNMPGLAQGEKLEIYGVEGSALGSSLKSIRNAGDTLTVSLSGRLTGVALVKFSAPFTDESTESADRQTAETSDELTAKPGNEKSMGPGDEQAAEPGGEQAAELMDKQTAEPGIEQPAEPGDEQSIEASGEQTMEPGDEQAAEAGDEQTTEPGDEQAAEAGDEQSIDASDEQPTEPGDEQAGETGGERTTEPGDGQAKEPNDELVDKSGGDEIAEPGNEQTTEPGNNHTTEPGEDKTVEPGDIQTTELSEDQPMEPGDEQIDPADKPTDEPKEGPVVFDQKAEVKAGQVSVFAAEGVFPADTVLVVEEEEPAPSGAKKARTKSGASKGRVVVASYTYNISIQNTEGESIQPENGTAKISFRLDEASDPNLAVRVTHYTGQGAEELSARREDGAVVVETDGFSRYTVEFSYNAKGYVLPGDETVALADILAALGLTGEVTEAVSSDPELFSVAQADGVWRLTSHKPFSTEETLTVTIRGIAYQITVTDEQDGPFEVNGTKYATLQEAVAAANNNHVILQTEDADDSSEVIITGKTITLKAYGQDVTLNSSSGYSKFVVKDSGKLILGGGSASPKLTLKKTVSNLAVGKNGTLEVVDGAELIFTEYGVDLDVWTGGKLNIRGGLIEHQNYWNGSAVSGGGGTVNVYGGTVCSLMGVAIEVGSKGTLNIYGGRIEAQKGYAAVDLAYSNSSMNEMKGGVIIGGTAIQRNYNSNGNAPKISDGVIVSLDDGAYAFSPEVHPVLSGTVKWQGEYDEDNLTVAEGYEIAPDTTTDSAYSGDFHYLNKQVEITYNGNGGKTANNETSITKGVPSTFTLDECKFLREGHVFKEWNRSADGQSEGFAEGSQMTIDEATTLYAIWEVPNNPVYIGETPYQTIRDAMAEAQDGDVIVVKGGVMDTSNTIQVEHDVTLRADTQDVTSVNAHLVVASGKALTLGGGEGSATLTLKGKVDVTNGKLVMQDGVLLRDEVLINGQEATASIHGGRVNASDTNKRGLTVSNGAKIDVIENAEFKSYGTALYMSGDAKITKILNSTFVSTNTTGAYLENGEIGLIDGADTLFQATGNNYGIIIKPNAKVGTIKNGQFKVERAPGKQAAVVALGQLDKIEGGVFDGGIGVEFGSQEYAAQHGCVIEGGRFHGQESYGIDFGTNPAAGVSFSISNATVSSDGSYGIIVGNGNTITSMDKVTASGSRGGLWLYNPSTSASDKITVKSITGCKIDGFDVLQNIEIGLMENNALSSVGLGVFHANPQPTVEKIIGGTISGSFTNYSKIGKIENVKFTTSLVNENYSDKTIGEITELSCDIDVSTNYGITNKGKIGTISGGTMKAAYAVINNKGGTIEAIGGGTFTAPRGGLLNWGGTIKTISDGTFEGSTHQGLWNYQGTIGTISGGTFTGQQSGILNGDTIGTITGGSFTGTEWYGIYNSAAASVIRQIAIPKGTESVFSGGLAAIGNYDASSIIGTVTGYGVFNGGTNGVLQNNAAAVSLETGIVDTLDLQKTGANPGYGRYLDPATLAGTWTLPTGYHMSKLTTAEVEAVRSTGYHFLVRDNTIIYKGNGHKLAQGEGYDDYTFFQSYETASAVVADNLYTTGSDFAFDGRGLGFLGWNTKADGSGTDYALGATVTIPTDGELILYAQWDGPVAIGEALYANIAAAMVDAQNGDIIHILRDYTEPASATVDKNVKIMSRDKETTVTLTRDIAVCDGASVTIGGGDYALNFKGAGALDSLNSKIVLEKNITVTTSSNAAVHILGGTATINGGKYTSSGQQCLHIGGGTQVDVIQNATFVATNTSATDVIYGFWLEDSDTVVESIKNCTFTAAGAKGHALHIRNKAKVKSISDSTFIGGTDGNAAESYGIHTFPGGTVDSIKNSTMKGGRGILLWDGNTTITGCTVEGLTVADPNNDYSIGLQIETHNGSTPSVTISGGTFSGDDFGVFIVGGTCSVEGAKISGSYGFYQYKDKNSVCTKLKNCQITGSIYGVVNAVTDTIDLIEGCTISAPQVGLGNLGTITTVKNSIISGGDKNETASALAAIFNRGSIGTMDTVTGTSDVSVLINDVASATIGTIKDGTYTINNVTVTAPQDFEAAIVNRSGTITTIDGAVCKGRTKAIYNAGAITTVSGGTFEGGEVGLYTEKDDSTVGLISGGTFTGGTYGVQIHEGTLQKIAIANAGDAHFKGGTFAVLNEGTIGTITGHGIFDGATDGVLSNSNSAAVPLENGVVDALDLTKTKDNPGYGRYSDPATLTGTWTLPTGYHMSKLTTTEVEATRGTGYHFLVRNNTIIYKGNGHKLAQGKGYDDYTFFQSYETASAVVADNLYTTGSDFAFDSDGKAFVKWNTAADGSGTDYAPGDTVTIPEGGELILYAQWTYYYEVTPADQTVEGDGQKFIDLQDAINATTAEKPKVLTLVTREEEGTFTVVAAQKVIIGVVAATTADDAVTLTVRNKATDEASDIFTVNGDLTLLEGVSVIKTGNQPHQAVTVAANAAFTVDGATVTTVRTGKYGLDYYAIDNSGTFTLKDGTVDFTICLSDSGVAQKGAAVYNRASGTVNMTGGTINTHVTNPTDGKTLGIANYGAATVSGGLIHSDNGTAIANEEDATLAIKGTARIICETVRSSGGDVGIIHNCNRAVITEISGNAYLEGKGTCQYGILMEFNSRIDKITDNAKILLTGEYTSSRMSVIEQQNFASYTIGEISGNVEIRCDKGYGIYGGYAGYQIGKITGNAKIIGGKGDGIYLYGNTTDTSSGSAVYLPLINEISGNVTVQGSLNGIQISSTRCGIGTISGGTFTGAGSNSNSNGVKMMRGAPIGTISGGTFTGDNAGLYIQGNGTTYTCTVGEIKGGTFKGTNGVTNKGMYMSSWATVEKITGGTFTCANDAYGIYMSSGTSLIKLIEGDTVNISGGSAIYLYDGEITKINGANITGTGSIGDGIYSNNGGKIGTIKKAIITSSMYGIRMSGANVRIDSIEGPNGDVTITAKFGMDLYKGSVGTITGATITAEGTGSRGIFVEGGSIESISGASAEDVTITGERGIHMTSGSIGTITGATITGGEYGIYLNNTDPTKATIGSIKAANLGDVVIQGNKYYALYNATTIDHLAGGVVLIGKSINTLNNKSTATIGLEDAAPGDLTVAGAPIMGYARYFLDDGTNAAAAQLNNAADAFVPTGYHMSQITTKDLDPNQPGGATAVAPTRGMPEKAYHFLIKNNTVIYRGNGHKLEKGVGENEYTFLKSFETATVTVDDNSYSTGSDFEFASDGIRFIGWDTKPDGSGTRYKAGDTVTIPAGEELILYAQWGKTITITVNGSSDSKVYTGSAQTSVTTVTPTCTDSLFDASKFSYSGATTITKTDVGTYNEEIDTTKAAYADDNLDVIFVKGTDVRFEITKKAITITVNGSSDSKVYTGSAQTSVTTVTPSCSDSLFDAAKFSYSGAMTITKTNAGSYTEAIDIAKCAYSDTNFVVNWKIGDPVKLTITPATLTITAKPQTYSYTGKPQGPAGRYTADFTTYIAIEGLQGSDKLTGITLNGQESKVGQYDGKIVPSAASIGTATDNYEIKYIPGTLTIKKAPKDSAPGTGDNTKIALWTSLLMASAVGCGGALWLAFKKKRSSDNRN